MAVAPDSIEARLQELEGDITCPGCYKHFQDPKILPCCHCYCKECIQKLASQSDGPLSCPRCHKDIFLPQNDPDLLPSAHFIDRMKDMYIKLGKSQGAVEATCDMCSEAKPRAFCYQCADFICNACMKSHQKMRVFSGHEVVSLEQFKKGGLKQVMVKADAPMMCAQHDEKLKIFCFDCSRTICRDCIMVGHTGHKCELIQTSALYCRAMLKEGGIEPLKKIQEDISEATRDVQQAKDEITTQGTCIVETIKKSFTKLHDILHQCQEELLKTSSVLVDQKVDTLSSQEDLLKSTMDELQSLDHFVEQNLECASDEEVIRIHHQILTRVGEECETHAHRDLRVTEKPNISLDIAFEDSLKDLCHKHADVYLDTTADPTKCTAEGPGTRVAEVGRSTVVLVHLVSVNGEPCRGRQAVEAELKSVVDGSTTRIKGSRKMQGTYEIAYCPNTRGCHNLTIMVNSRPIAGSPLRVLVKIHPNKLGSPVQLMGGLEKPWGVAVNTLSQILVTEWESNQVTILAKSGKKVKTIGSKHPTGIALDREGNIFVTDDGNSLLKLNKDGDLLKVVKSKLCDPGGVRVIGNCVYVCDRGNNRIAVFNTELQYVRTVGSEGSGNGQFRSPQDVALDTKGNLYITDKRNRHVQVFNKEGHFVCVFGSDHLDAPTCMCFGPSQQYLYVVDSRKDCISVFDVNGYSFVSSFARHGRRQGHLNNPMGIAVDYDGFVYVCDHGNDRIQKF